MQQDDLNDLLALGGSISRQINESNSMRVEQDKLTIPRINPRALMANGSSNVSNNGTLPPLPIGLVPTLNDAGYPAMNGLNITPMAPLIPLDLALTDGMRKAGVKASDLVPTTPNSIPKTTIPATIARPVQVAVAPVLVPQTDPNQIEFGFIEKLGGPKYANTMEYLQEKFAEFDITLSKINQKLDILVNKKKKI